MKKLIPFMLGAILLLVGGVSSGAGIVHAQTVVGQTVAAETTQKLSPIGSIKTITGTISSMHVTNTPSRQKGTTSFKLANALYGTVVVSAKNSLSVQTNGGTARTARDLANVETVTVSGVVTGDHTLNATAIAVWPAQL